MVEGEKEKIDKRGHYFEELEKMFINELQSSDVVKKIEWNVERQKRYEEKQLKKKKSLFFELKKCWDEYFDCICYFNPEYSSILFHVLLSKLLRYKIVYNNDLIDPTLHAFVIMVSGTGKGQGTKALIEFIKSWEDEFGLNVEVYTETTDAGLVGTRKSEVEIKEIKEKMKDRKRKQLVRILNNMLISIQEDKKLDNKMKEKLQKNIYNIAKVYNLNISKEKGYEEIVDEDFNEEEIYVNKGSLVTADFLIFPEAQTLFREKVHSENARKILQDALDINGFVAKKLGGVSIFEKAKASVIFTSHMFEEFKVELLKTGLLQRVILYVEEPSRKKAQKISIRNFLSVADLNGYERKEKLKKKLKEKIDLARKNAEFVEKVYIKDKNILKKFIKEWSRYGKQVLDEFASYNLEEVLIPFLTRAPGIIIKIASQVAVVNGREEIMYDDLEYALNMHRMVMNSVFNVLEEVEVGEKEKKTVEDDRKRIILAYIRNLNEQGKKPNQTELVEVLKNVKQLNMGEVRLKNLIMKMEKENLIKFERGPHNRKLYYV